MCWTDGWLQPSAHSGAGIVNGWWTARLGRDTHTHTHTHTHSRLRTITCTPTCTHTFTPNGVFRGCLKLNWQGLSATVRCILASSCHTYIISHTQAHTHTHTQSRWTWVMALTVLSACGSAWHRLAFTSVFLCLPVAANTTLTGVCVLCVCVCEGRETMGRESIYLSIYLSSFNFCFSLVSYQIFCYQPPSCLSLCNTHTPAVSHWLCGCWGELL